MASRVAPELVDVEFVGMTDHVSEPICDFLAGVSKNTSNSNPGEASQQILMGRKGLPSFAR